MAFLLSKHTISLPRDILAIIDQFAKSNKLEGLTDESLHYMLTQLKSCSINVMSIEKHSKIQRAFLNLNKKIITNNHCHYNPFVEEALVSCEGIIQSTWNGITGWVSENPVYQTYYYLSVSVSEQFIESLHKHTPDNCSNINSINRVEYENSYLKLICSQSQFHLVTKYKKIAENADTVYPPKPLMLTFKFSCLFRYLSKVSEAPEEWQSSFKVLNLE